MGKDYLSDILESKRTLMVIHCLTEARPSDRERLIGLLRQRNAKSSEETAEVLDLLKRYKSLEYARAKAAELVLGGRSCLAALRESHARDILASMAGYFLERQL
jgi:octaprenyl-diphosphate synthase